MEYRKIGESWPELVLHLDGHDGAVVRLFRQDIA